MDNVKKVAVVLFAVTIVYLASLAVIYAENESSKWYCRFSIDTYQIEDPTFQPENQSEYLVFNESYLQIAYLIIHLDDCTYLEDWRKAEAIHNQTYGKETQPHWFKLNGTREGEGEHLFYMGANANETHVFSEYFYWQPNGTYWLVTNSIVRCGFLRAEPTVQVTGVALTVLWGVTAVMWIRERKPKDATTSE